MAAYTSQHILPSFLINGMTDIQRQVKTIIIINVDFHLCGKRLKGVNFLNNAP
jgi:hypothetical protein